MDESKGEKDEEIMVFNASEPAKWLNPTAFHMSLVSSKTS